MSSPKPDSGAPGAPSKPTLGETGRAFVNLLRSGKHAAAHQHFAEKTAAAMPVDQLGALWPGLVKQLGEFKSVTRVQEAREGRFDVVRVTCQFASGGVDFKIVYDAERKVSGLWIQPPSPATDYEPPDYVDQSAFTEREVTVGAGEWALPGTLSLPKKGAPVAAVVLVHGSGPNDRDLSLSANKPFRDLAWGLASKGVAALRYDKRTKHHARRLTGEVLEKMTLNEETVDDAVLAAEAVRKADGIDPGRVYVLGISLGGRAIPRIAKRDSKAAGFILMAGSTRPMEDAILEQTRYLLGLDGLSSEDETAVAAIEAQVKRVKGLKPGSKVPASELPLGVHPHYWLDLRSDDPPRDLAKERRRVLVMQGDRDYQVTIEDFRGWERALKGKANVTMKRYPDLNHLFMKGSGKSTPKEYETPGHVSVEVVDDLVAWIGGG